MGKSDFVIAIRGQNIIEADNVVLGVFVDGDVPLLNAAAEGFEQIAREIAQVWRNP